MQVQICFVNGGFELIKGNDSHCMASNNRSH
jgi:hypothetical protein